MYKVYRITKKHTNNIHDVYVGSTTEDLETHLSMLRSQSKHLPYTKLLRRIAYVGTFSWKIDCLWIGFCSKEAFEMEKKFRQELKPDLTHWECPEYNVSMLKNK